MKLWNHKQFLLFSLITLGTLYPTNIISQSFNEPNINEVNQKTFTTDEEGDKIKIGKEILEGYFCPGHTPGHIIFFSRISRLAIVGDVLFNGSIGRTDLPGGNFDQLINSVKNKLWPLGNEIQFIPGHGPSSTFEQEKKSNPFVSESALNKT